MTRQRYVNVSKGQNKTSNFDCSRILMILVITYFLQMIKDIFQFLQSLIAMFYFALRNAYYIVTNHHTKYIFNDI